MNKDKETDFKRWFRMNCAPGDRAKVLDLLKAEGFEPSMVHPPTGAMQVKEEFIPLGNSLANYFGFIYVQDISSMLKENRSFAPPQNARAAHGVIPLYSVS